MKQNDFALTNSDLKAAALTLSDLYTYPDLLIDASKLQFYTVPGKTYFNPSPFVAVPPQTSAALTGF